MTKAHHEKQEHPRAKESQGGASPAEPETGAASAAPAAAPPLGPAAEAEAFCAELDRFFRRAFGDLPKSADLHELKGHQAAVRDMVRRAAEVGGEGGAKLAAASAERDKLKEDLVRARADFLNYQARAAKDLERAEEQALRRYMLDMLPILDSVLLSVNDAQSAASPDTGRLKDAIGLIYNSLGQTLAVRGLQRIVVEAGKPFDPNVHEAVALRPAQAAKGEKPNMVLEELRAGYLWKGLLLRPAQVLVAEPEKKTPGNSAGKPAADA